MTLFSTLVHFNCLLLFLYLGLSCGIVFGFLQQFVNKLKNFLIKKIDCKIEKLETVKNDGQKGGTLPKNKLNHNKIKQRFYKFLNMATICVSSCLLVASFVSLIVISFFVNLKYNFGVLKFWYVLIWIISFYLGNVFVKIVANLFVNFYNYFEVK